MIWDYLIFLCCGFCLFSFVVLTLSVLYLYFTVLKNRPNFKQKVKGIKKPNSVSNDTAKATDAEFREAD